MNRMLCALLTTALLPAPILAQHRTHDVSNDGDHVDITPVSSPTIAAPDADFFTPRPLPLYSSTMTITDLAEHYDESFREGERSVLLETIGRVKPRTERDIRALLNLYNREGSRVREPVQKSLQLLTPKDRHYEEFFLMLLGQEETSFKAFGMLGALRIRSQRALPSISAMANDDLDQPSRPERVALSLHALAVLSEWKVPDTRRLLLKQIKKKSQVAALLAAHYWEESLPDFVKWSQSDKPAKLDWARNAWRADVPVESLRPTIPRLRELVLDADKNEMTRHMAALKLGFAADDAEVDTLLSLHESSTDALSRLYLKGALFSSRNPKVIPLLTRHAKTDPSPNQRMGAISQLKYMLTPVEYHELLAWVSQNDQDDYNRNVALKELSHP